MSAVFVAAASVIVGLSAITLVRVAAGRTAFDRLLAAGAVGTNVIVLLATLGFIFARPDLFVDLAITYAFLNFIGAVIAGKYLERQGREDGGGRGLS